MVMAVNRQEPLANVRIHWHNQNWQMRLVKMRCAFHRHGAAHMNIRRFNFIFAKAKIPGMLNSKSFSCVSVMPNLSLQKSAPRVNWLNANLMSNALPSAASILSISALPKPLSLSAFIDTDWQVFRVARTNRIANDIVDLALNSRAAP